MTEKLKALQELVQNLIDDGATTVEQVHRSIASMPFDMLEKIGAIEKPVSRARELHDEAVGNIYETIRLLNDRVGGIAKELLTKLDKPRS